VEAAILFLVRMINHRTNIEVNMSDLGDVGVPVAVEEGEATSPMLQVYDPGHLVLLLVHQLPPRLLRLTD
jgi:hypothetical protein